LEDVQLHLIDELELHPPFPLPFDEEMLNAMMGMATLPLLDEDSDLDDL